RQAAPLDAVGDLARHTLLHPTRDHRDWRAWLDHAGERAVDAERGPTFDTLDLATNAAMQGFGVAIGDVTLVDDDVSARRLERPFDIVLETGARYFFVYPESIGSQQKIRAFSDWIAAHRD
ncbi:LysR family transcriptional regulator, partial [Burkholderia territorii]